jgi:hypothetical protein
MTRDILCGPAVIQYAYTQGTAPGSVPAVNTIYTQDDIVVTHSLETIPVMTSQFGKVDDVVTDRLIEITCTPAALWQGGSSAFAGRVALLFPHLASSVGAWLFPVTQAAERPLRIWTIPDGKTYEYQSAAITKMPSLRCAAEKQLCGPMTFRCIQELATSTNAIQAWSAATSVLADGTVAFADTSFGYADILQDIYTGAWGSVTGFTAIDTAEGFEFDWDVSFTPIKVDAYGTVNWMLTDAVANCRVQPVGVSVADLIASMKLQGTGAARGQSLAAIQSASSLVVSGSAAGRVKVTLYGAQIKTAPTVYGQTALRIGQVEFAGSLQSSSATKTIAAIGTV